jgi:hypothetical protein
VLKKKDGTFYITKDATYAAIVGPKRGEEGGIFY